MECIFDRSISRFGTNSAKWDGTANTYGPDIIPLSVADMDYQVPQPVLAEAESLAKHGIFGYTELNPPYYAAVQHWLSKQYQWDVPAEWIVFSPRIIQAVSLIIQEFTTPGDSIMMHTPAYQPIANAVKLNGRRFVGSPLKLIKGRYEIDYEQMEQHMKEGIKLLILCSPHNPTGRVWTRAELLRMAELCVKYDVLIVSDDIHADFIRDGHEHTIIAKLNEQIAMRTFVCTSPGKTFNLASIEIANIIIPNAAYRQRFHHSLQKAGIHNPTFFAPRLLEVAYTACDDWLQELKHYIENNLHFVTRFIEQQLPMLSIIEPEGTYLLWIDCRQLTADEEKLKQMFLEAKVMTSLGSSFGAEGGGFIRLNLAAPRILLEESLKRFQRVVEKVNT